MFFSHLQFLNGDLTDLIIITIIIIIIIIKFYALFAGNRNICLLLYNVKTKLLALGQEKKILIFNLGDKSIVKDQRTFPWFKFPAHTT